MGLPTSRSLLPSTVSRSAPRQRGAGSQQLAMMATQKPQDKGGKAKAGANGAAEVGIFHPEHPYRDALVKTALSVGAALLFGLGVWQFKGAESALEYYSGYVRACVRACLVVVAWCCCSCFWTRVIRLHAS